MSRLDRIAPWTVLLVVAVLVVLTACNGDDTGPATATATESYSLGPIKGGREPVERSLPPSRLTPTLTDVQTMSMGPFDRVTFFLARGLPSYRVEYVSSPFTACGSGEPVDVAGKAFLQIRMSPAAAHDDQGNPTFDLQELTPDLPTVVEMQQTCDFEGELTWVIGLSEEVDFRADIFGPPLTRNFILVDVAHTTDDS